MILTPGGITDVRPNAREIPWASIIEITTSEIASNRFIVLKAEPATAEALDLSRRTRATLAANRRLGIGGLAVSAQEFDVDTDVLPEEYRLHWQRGRDWATAGRAKPG